MKSPIFWHRYSQNYKLTPAPSENCFAIFLLRVRSNNYLEIVIPMSSALKSSFLTEYVFTLGPVSMARLTYCFSMALNMSFNISISLTMVLFSLEATFKSDCNDLTDDN
jgi:hypothetical protein